MTGLFAAALAGWLCLFLLVLAAAAARRRAPQAALPPLPGAESPAVIGLLAKGPAMRLYQATLLDLSARGWFWLRLPGPAAAWAGGDPGPAMCELAAEQPRDALTPYDRRALAHVAFRAGGHDEVPAPPCPTAFRRARTRSWPASAARSSPTRVAGALASPGCVPGHGRCSAQPP